MRRFLTLFAVALGLSFVLVPTAVAHRSVGHPRTAHRTFRPSRYVLRCGRHPVVLTKRPYGVAVRAGGSQRVFFYRNERQFALELKKFLDHEFGRRRPGIGSQAARAYRAMRLQESAGRPPAVAPEHASDRRGRMASASPRAVVGVDLARMPFGAYRLDGARPPPTYLLVRNADTNAYYCLSFVQEQYDAMYGLGEAAKIGLYSAPYAEQLNFQEESVDVRTFDPQTARTLPPGTVLRLGHDADDPASTLSHVGIVIAPGKVGHVIGGTLYIDPIGRLSDGWVPVYEVVPRQLPHEQIIRPIASGTRFNRRATLEQIGTQLLAARPDLTRYRAAAEEIVYRLNRRRFRITSYGGPTVAELVRPGPVLVPSAWHL